VSSRSANTITRVAAALLRVRWLVRAPIWLYRARLGFLLGTRFLMLEHIGRKSGRPRYVVLEVIDRPMPGRYVVISGFGERAQWFRNVLAHPHVLVYLGSHKPRPAKAERLDQETTTASLSRYAAINPRSWAKLRPVLEQTLGARIDESGTELPMIALDITGDAAVTP
jgi:deazaflavin-dependent oxidoreductase (nitroreductase family)